LATELGQLLLVGVLVQRPVKLFTAATWAGTSWTVMRGSDGVGNVSSVNSDGITKATM